MPASQSYEIEISDIQVLIIISKVSLFCSNHRTSPAYERNLKIN
jgi:hypothetical protein